MDTTNSASSPDIDSRSSSGGSVATKREKLFFSVTAYESLVSLTRSQKAFPHRSL